MTKAPEADSRVAGAIGVWFVVAISVLTYALLWCGWVLRWPVLIQSDNAVLQPLASYGAIHPGWVSMWDLLCRVFTPGLWRLLLLIPIGWLLWRRRVREAVFLALTVEGSALVLLLAKGLADRPRPSTALVHATGTSFPSGHAFGTAAMGLAILITVWPRLSHRSRVWLTGCCGALILAVGLGRVILNVHHPSDVVAGWALALPYLMLCRWLTDRPWSRSQPWTRIVR